MMEIKGIKNRILELLRIYGKPRILFNRVSSLFSKFPFFIYFYDEFVALSNQVSIPLHDNLF